MWLQIEWTLRRLRKHLFQHFVLLRMAQEARQKQVIEGWGACMCWGHHLFSQTTLEWKGDGGGIMQILPLCVAHSSAIVHLEVSPVESKRGAGERMWGEGWSLTSLFFGRLFSPLCCTALTMLRIWRFKVYALLWYRRPVCSLPHLISHSWGWCVGGSHLLSTGLIDMNCTTP